MSLAPGEQTTLTAVFDPGASDVRVAAVHIDTDMRADPGTTFSVRATAAAEIVLEPVSLVVEGVPGQVLVREFQIRRFKGPAGAMSSVIGVSSPGANVLCARRAESEERESVSVTVTLPQVSGIFSYVVNVCSDHPFQPVQAVRVTAYVRDPIQAFPRALFIGPTAASRITHEVRIRCEPARQLEIVSSPSWCDVMLRSHAPGEYSATATLRSPGRGIHRDAVRLRAGSDTISIPVVLAEVR
jgi:hypothetical protein